MMLVDEAYQQARSLAYGCVELFTHEAISLLETMVAPESLIRRTEFEIGAEEGSSGNMTVALCLIHPEQFMSQMETIGKSEGYLKPLALITIDSAELAIKRLSSMAEESWFETRSVILKLCCSAAMEEGQDTKKNRSRKAKEFSPRNDMRPSALSSTDVDIFVGSIGLEPSHYRFETGSALLNVRKDEARALLGLSSSILLLRFYVFQKVLQLLDSWWDKNTKIALMPCTSFSRDGNSWGLLDISWRHNHSQIVEIACFPKLLLAFTTLNRTLGFSIPIEMLTILSANLAGNTGLLLPVGVSSELDGEESRSDGNSTCGSAESESEVEEALSCCGWVNIGELTIEEADLAVFYDTGLVKRTDVSSSQRFLSVLLPFNSTRALYSRVINTHQNLTATAFNMEVGIVVKIDGNHSLTSACGRFDWWDRPTKQYLELMANRRAEVVSVHEVFQKHRVGVRILGQGDICIVVDVLPIECLMIDENQSLEDVQSLSLEPSTKKSSKQKSKKKKSAKTSRGISLTNNNQRSRKPVASVASSATSIDNSTIATSEGLPIEIEIEEEQTETYVEEKFEEEEEESGEREIQVSQKGVQLKTVDIQDTQETEDQRNRDNLNDRVEREIEGNSIDDSYLDPDVKGEYEERPVVVSSLPVTERVDSNTSSEFDIAIKHVGFRVTSTSKISETPLLTVKKVALTTSKEKQIPSLTKPIVPSPQSSYSWMKPLERLDLQQVLEQQQQEEEKLKENQDLNNPLAFISVNGQRYESFGIYRLHGIPLRRPLAVSNSTTKIHYTQSALEIIQQQAKADMLMEAKESLQRQQSYLDEFVQRARTDSELEINIPGVRTLPRTDTTESLLTRIKNEKDIDSGIAVAPPNVGELVPVAKTFLQIKPKPLLYWQKAAWEAIATDVFNNRNTNTTTVGTIVRTGLKKEPPRLINMGVSPAIVNFADDADPIVMKGTSIERFMRSPSQLAQAAGQSGAEGEAEAGKFTLHDKLPFVVDEAIPGDTAIVPPFSNILRPPSTNTNKAARSYDGIDDELSNASPRSPRIANRNNDKNNKNGKYLDIINDVIESAANLSKSPSMRKTPLIWGTEDPFTMDNLLRRFPSPIGTKAHSFWMQDKPVPSPYPVVNKYVISNNNNKNNVLQENLAQLEIKAVPVVRPKSGLPSSASSRKQSQAVMSAHHGGWGGTGVEEEKHMDLMQGMSHSHKLLDIKERPRSPSPTRDARETSSPLPPITIKKDNSNAVRVPMLPLAYIEKDTDRSVGEGEIDTERIIESYRELMPEIVGTTAADSLVLVVDDNENNNQSGSPTMISQKDTYDRDKESPQRSRFQDIPIMIKTDQPLHDLKEERRLQRQVSEIKENTFDFAPLVDELLAQRVQETSEN